VIRASPLARWYLDEALAQVPRVLTLEDRDPSSPTYGCFDRNYWHYRTQDFPSGMYQELALALARAWALDAPGNPWRGEPRLRDLAVAGVRYAARSAHRDGSCDDYYPYERALGATAFAAAAAAQALLILGERAPDLLAFVERRARWLLSRQESGRLSNHQALVALAAARAAALTGKGDLLEGARERLDLCLSWQESEGWFVEYEGADPGYQTLTIAFLAALREHLPSEALDRALDRAVGFAAHFLWPDGSYGGEIGSRNTCQVLPSGFERLAGRSPAAKYLADGWLAGARAGKRGYPDDDRIFSHWLQDYFEAHAARAAREGAPGGGAGEPWRPPAGRTSFEAAGLHVIREGDLTLAIATGKGGVFRAYRGERLLANDTGLVAVSERGERFVSHGVDRAAAVEWENGAVTIRGTFRRAPRRLATPAKMVVFRLVNATIGRLAPNLLRRLLQRALITGAPPAPLVFERRIAWRGEARGGIEVRDRIAAAHPEGRRVAQLFASTDATSIYVATSNLWQDASRRAWEALEGAAALRDEGACELIRSYA
jgi:hypothetical protein